MSMQKTIEELVQCGQLSGPATAFLNCLTLDGKIDEGDALKGLSGRERAILNGLLKQSAESDARQDEFVLSMRSHGRLVVLPAAEHETHSKVLTKVASLFIPSEENHQIHKAHQEDVAVLARGEPTLNAFFSTQGYEEIACRLNSAVKNMAPLLFYIGDECYSNFYNIGKGEVPWEHEIHAAMRVLAERGAEAPVAVRTLAVCLELLLRSGTYTRAEEMNSCQLNISTLRAHFLVVFDRYRHISTQEGIDRDDFRALSVVVQASVLADLRLERQKSGIFVRDINGLNLLKKERYFNHKQEEKVLGVQRVGAKKMVERMISEHIGSEFEWTESTISGLISADDGLFAAHPFNSGMEYLIDLIIKNSIIATNSDVGMSRGTRNLGYFTAAWLRKDTKMACEWTQAEYYCHAVASSALMGMMPAKKMNGLVNAVSSRMRYNTWHYAPSYFKIEDIPEARGWFHAPRMADIAEWSDHHHAGHVHAAVRYSIRSPKSVRIHGEVLHGLTDLRLMRQAGRRYTLGDLAVAIDYTDALGFVYQELADAITKGLVDFEFKFGSKAWIDAYYTALANEALMAA